MLSIYAPEELIPILREYIATEDRLDELVEVHDLLAARPAPSAYHFIVRPRQGIVHTLDWHNVMAPYLLPEEIELTRDNLLGLVFAKIDNWEQAEAYTQNNPMLWHELRMLFQIQKGIPSDPGELTSSLAAFEEYRFCHNSAILHHYAATEESFDPEKTRYFYREAIQSAPNGEYAAFTARQMAAFLQDMGELDMAETILQQALPQALSDDAAMALKTGLCGVWMAKLTVPYDRALLEHLKSTLWEVLQYYEREDRQEEIALTLVEAARIAHYTESWSEGLGYINRAIAIFEAQDQEAFLAPAHYQRALLLYSWAKKGNPQFFQGALDSFKIAAAVFNRENAPDVFAEIQQYLGIIYAEMPDEALKRSMWAAISSSSFQEALRYYTREERPYEYAMVCNHYGNALTKYPPATHTDNIEKALFYYNEALNIRTAEALPVERAATLLNYVEACWSLNLEGRGAGEEVFADMLAKAQEAQALAIDPQMRDEAAQQLARLENLRQTLAAETEPHA